MVIMPEEETLQLERLNDGIVQTKVWKGKCLGRVAAIVQSGCRV